MSWLWMALNSVPVICVYFHTYFVLRVSWCCLTMFNLCCGLVAFQTVLLFTLRQLSVFFGSISSIRTSLPRHLCRYMSLKLACLFSATLLHIGYIRIHWMTRIPVMLCLSDIRESRSSGALGPVSSMSMSSCHQLSSAVNTTVCQVCHVCCVCQILFRVNA